MELTQAQVSLLQRHLNSIKEAGAVCKADVISIEQAIPGLVVVEDKMKGFMSEQCRTTLGYPTVCDSIETIIKKSVPKTSFDDLYVFKGLHDELAYLTDVFKEIASRIPDRLILDRLIDKKYTLKYIGTDDEYTIVDVSKDSIIKAFRHTDYLQAIVDTSKPQNMRMFDSIFNNIETAHGDTSYESYNYYQPYLKYLLMNKVESYNSVDVNITETITPVCLHYLLSNASLIADNLDHNRIVFGSLYNDSLYTLKRNTPYYSTPEDVVAYRHILSELNSPNAILLCKILKEYTRVQ